MASDPKVDILEEVTKHNSTKDCWLIIYGKEGYWKWIPSANLPISAQFKFLEVAYLLEVCWLEIGGRIETKILSPNTRYGAYLIYTIKGDFHLLYIPAKVSIRFENENEGNGTIAYLQPDTPEGVDGQVPRRREDMWFEIEIGEFFNGKVDSLVGMHLICTAGDWKSGLVVHGIEHRPK
ncbi:F-box protein At2g02240-like [Corylus avellana]|uniref:F-box protein At2g02240-like n=1 Tax=Corylus avellana TaxID=13451 RepID=UPI00286B89F5|nr:F-box protein At2g02240-like [Corylus avellana]